MTDRTPLILAALDDLLRERVESHPDDADLLALADGVALAVDHGEAARLWPPTGDDQVSAEAVAWAIASEERHAVTGTTPIRIAVARRLADVAASLLVRGDVMRREADALWSAASRLLGLDATADRAEELAKVKRIIDLDVEVRNQGRLIADMTRMIADKDALIDGLRNDVTLLRKAAAEPPKVDLRPKVAGGPTRVRVRLWSGNGPLTREHVGQEGKVIAANPSEGRWNIQLDSGFTAWVPRDAVEVLP
jgi:hypothetical protein